MRSLLTPIHPQISAAYYVKMLTESFGPPQGGEALGRYHGTSVQNGRRGEMKHYFIHREKNECTVLKFSLKFKKTLLRR